MLIQETGLQRELNLDEIARRTTENEAALLERKVAASFIQGSGAIEWLWNTNSYMTESNETPIGAVRTDYTEKPEATLLRAFAQFAPSLQEHLRDPQQPQSPSSRRRPPNIRCSPIFSWRPNGVRFGRWPIPLIFRLM